jgi:Domain of unknown function (DUF4296)
MIRLLLIASLILISSCSDGIKRKDAPDNLIPEDQMVEVIKELVKLEAYIKTEYVSVAKFHKVMINSGDSLLAAHDLDKETFEKSLEYYGSRPDEMEVIYSEALDELNKELGELQAEK